MKPRVLLYGLALATCSPEPTVVAIDLTDDPSCSTQALAQISSVSIEVYGDAGGALCTIARRCVTIEAPAGLAEIASALKTATQPLIDVGISGTRQIAVLGHTRLGCGEGDRVLCGFVELADVEDDILSIPVHCERADEAPRCPAAVPPFCP